MRRTLSVGLIVGIAGLAGPDVLADTEVGGPICEDTTWDLAGSPYIVTGSIIVSGGATLTIEPGVEVRFDAAKALTIGYAVDICGNSHLTGALVARGTQDAPIRFTSNTNNQPGDWARIYFLDQAVDATFDGDVYQSGSVLEHVIVEYGGSGNVAAVTVANAAPWLANCDIHENQERGIYVNGQNAPGIRIEYCQISNHANGCGVYIGFGSAHRLAGNTISANTASSGGGICFTNSAGGELFDNTITANTAARGGGIYFSYSSGNTLSGNSVSGNTASNGGGIYFDYGSGSNTLTENTISGNTASSYGGGMYFAYHANDGSTLSGEWITRNTAAEGGGIYFDGSDNCSLDGCVVAANTITGNGTTGGIYLKNDARGISLAGDPDNEVYNTICLNDGYQVRNDNAFRPDGLTDVDARHVIWLTCDAQEIQDGIYDYFDDASKAMVYCNPFVDSLAADLDGDCDVDHSDLGILLGDWGCVGSEPGDCPGDCDFDIDTDHSDLGILLGHWGEVCP